MQYLEYSSDDFLSHTPGVLFQLLLAVLKLLLENICNSLHNMRRNSPSTSANAVTTVSVLAIASAQSADLKTSKLGLKRM